MLSDQQQRALNIVKSGDNLLVTGPAGCGKSYLMKEIIEWANDEDKKIAVTALTGMAATIIPSGQTLHSWAGIGLGKESKERLVGKIHYSEKKKTEWIETDILIIDEISMMTTDLFNKLDHIGKRIRENFDKPFGGIQLIVTGDFCQLPPVDSELFCFQSASWPFRIHNTIYLNKNFRQGDGDFQKMLNEIRVGKVSKKTKEILNSRIITSNSDFSDEIKPTILYPHNIDVEKTNQKEFTSLIEENKKSGETSKEVVSISEDEVKIKKGIKGIRLTAKMKRDALAFVNKNCPVPAEIKLCVGSQVMLMYNYDIEQQLVNGSRGVIKSFINNEPVVSFVNGAITCMPKHTWEIEHPTLKITRTQTPLKLAWSTSIHKSQGSTLDYVVTDLRKIFAPGQAYVTLSRVRSLNGLFLKGVDYRKIVCHPEVKKFYDCLEKGVNYVDETADNVDEDELDEDEEVFLDHCAI